MTIKFELNTKKIAKDIDKITKRMDKAAANTLQRSTEVKVAKLSFDEIESIPFAQKDSTRVVINPEQYKDNPFSLESILAQETKDFVDNTLDVLSDELKEVFK